jgi:hypothetical protein
MDTTDVREAARSAMNQSKSFVTRLVDERTRQLGEQIGSTARDLRKVGDDLRSSTTLAPLAEYADQGATLVDRLAAYLDGADADRLLGDLENLARRQPWAIAAGAAALGFAGSRFLKTSSARRYRSALEESGEAGSGAGTYGQLSSPYGTPPTYGGGSATYGT